MPTTMKSIRLLLPFALVLLSGCFHLAREEPVRQYYVLGGGQPSASGTQSTGLDGLTIGVRQLQIADYLLTPLIVVRRGSNTVDFSEFHQWGEDLSRGIARAVAGFLAARAPFNTVDVAPWQPQSRYDCLIQLHVSAFEGVVPAGEAHLLAAWEIIRQQDGEVLARGTTEYRGDGWKLDDFDGLVAKLDTGLGVLSDDLIASLGTLVKR